MNTHRTARILVIVLPATLKPLHGLFLNVIYLLCKNVRMCGMSHARTPVAMRLSHYFAPAGSLALSFLLALQIGILGSRHRSLIFVTFARVMATCTCLYLSHPLFVFFFYRFHSHCGMKWHLYYVIYHVCASALCRGYNREDGCPGPPLTLHYGDRPSEAVT